jgi:hypothetical protein
VNCKQHQTRLRMGSVLLSSTWMTAKEHAHADLRCGRKWTCQCSACNAIRTCPNAGCIDIAQRLRFLKYAVGLNSR